MKILSFLYYFLGFPLKALAVLFVCQMPGLALPQGGQVTQGSATIQQVGDTKLNINQSSDRAVINWNSFSIAPQEWVNFQQPSSTSATLNRVTGNTPSSIAGRLTANGQVFLVNPNGIAFLPTAQVDVAGLVASTLNIKDTDFMQGILRFEQMPGKPPASVVNEGLITVQEAGFAALVAPAVRNSGVISARLGKVVLASGTTVSLDFYGDGLLSVTVDPKLAGEITDIYGNKLSSLIDNQGNILAPGGVVTLTAQAAGQIVDSVINVGGIIEAKYAENRNGVIVLSGGSKGTVAVNGTLDVSGEKGGKVEITGEKIALNGNASIDASGDKGGGVVNIGGSFQGKGTLQNALETTVAKDVQIKVDAVTSGDGGKIIVWADGTTKFEGFISARGGELSGNGGFAEISGKETLDLGANWANQIQLSAPNGKFGTLLLDPNDITIVTGSVAAIGSSPTNSNTLGASDIQAFLGTASLIIETTGTGGNGDITINSGVNITWSEATTLTLNADRKIVMNPGAIIENTSTTTGFDAIVFNANKSGTTTGNFVGINLINSKLTTNGGNIILTGTGGNTGSSNYGILQQSGAQVTSTDGNITYTGTGGNGTNFNHGISLTGTDTTISTTGTGTINLTGTGKGTGSGSFNIGIVQEAGAQVSTTSGNITYTGTGGNGTNSNIGILLVGVELKIGTNTKISTGTGAISLTGIGNGTGKNNYGILQQARAQVTSTDGNITYTGTGGNGTDFNIGIFLTGTDTTISATGTGAISLTGTGKGTGSGSFNIGIVQEVSSQVTTTNGNITYTGTGGNGTDSNFGILLKNTTISTTGTGAISLTGTGNGTGSDNFGILQQASAQVSTTSGNITYTGTGANGADAIFTQTGANLIGNDSTGVISITSTNNPITLNDVTVKTTNNILITSPASVTQNNNGGLFSNGLELTGAGSFTLTNINNDIDILAGNTTNNIQFTDTNGFDIGTVNVTNGVNVGGNNLTLTAGDTVTQSQSIIANGLELLGAGAFTLTNANNDIDILAGNTTNNIKFTDTNGFDIGTVNVTNGVNVTASKNLTLTAGDTVTQSQSIIANGLELLGAGAFTLTNANNDINILAGNTTNNINYVDKNSLTVATVNSTTGINTSGNITVESGDTLTVEAGIDGVVSSAGTTTLTATNDIIFGTVSNFGDTRGQKLVLNAGRDIIIDNATFVESDGSGGIDLFAGRDFKIASAISAGSLLNSNAGGAPINIKVGGTFTLNSGAPSGIAANGGNITITADQMALTSGNIGSSGQLLLQPLNAATTIGLGTGATGTLNLDTAEIGRLLDGFSLITIGRPDGTGKIDIRTAQFKDNVIIRSPAGTGTININGALSTGTGTETGTIALLAGESIIGNTGSITTQGKAILLHSDFDATNGGAIKLTDTNINSNDGNITLGGGLDPLNDPAIGTSTIVSGIILDGANLTAGAGNISLRGQGFNTGSNNYGIHQLNASQVSTTTGSITYTGTGGNGTNFNHGIFLFQPNTTISTDTGAISLTGIGNGTGIANYGILQSKGAQVTSSDGSITYTGTGGNGTNFNHGILLANPNTKISTTGTGAISLTGTSKGTGSDNYGIFQQLSAQVTSTNGSISYTGTGGNGTDFNYGILLQDANTKISTGTGAISLTGTGNGTGFKNYGIHQKTGAQVTSTDGSITYTGTGGNGTSNNFGILLFDTNTEISTVTGAISLTGTGNGTGSNNFGILQFSKAQVKSTDGDITYTGTGGNGINSNYGISLNGADTKISTTGTGAISLTGTGNGTGTDNYGILQELGAQVTTSAGNITYTGTGGNGTDSNIGILLANPNTKISTTGTGAIILTGTGNGTGNNNYGIFQKLSAQVTTIDGSITYTGTGGNGINRNYGIFLNGVGTTISTTGTGAISLTGTGNGTSTDNYGILQNLGAQVTSSDGNITYTGTGANGADAIFTQTGANLIGNNTTGVISITSTNNPITLNDVTVKTTNNILITSPASVTQNNNGGLFSNGLELTGAGSFTLTNINNDINILAGNTTNNIQFTDTNGFDIGTVNVTNGVNVGGNNLTLTAGNTVTQSQSIIANGLALLGSGKFNLQNTGNTINFIAGDTTNDISFVNSQTLTVSKVNPTGITTTGNVFLQALTGDIVLEAINGQISAKNITLVADSNFINNFGASALVTTGNFLVYATSPAGNVNGWPVLGGSEQFNTTFPQPALFAGSGFLYKVGDVIPPFVPGLPSGSTFTTAPITFVVNFNDRLWRDLSDLGEVVLFPEALSLLCVNVPVNQVEESPALTDPIILRTENLPEVRIEWQTGKFPVCSSSN